MDTAALFSALRNRGVKLWIEEGVFKVSAPVGTIDAALRATLASRKEELLALLRQTEMLKSLPPSIVPIKPEGSRPPVFAVSGHGGDIFSLRALARRLDADQPVFGVQPPGLDGTEPLTSVEALAQFEIEQIRRYQASGPYLIAGHCAGGVLAFEVAQQLTASGQEVALLALIGSPFPTAFRRAPQILQRLGQHTKALTTGSLAERRHYITSRLSRRLWPPEVLAGVSPATTAARERVERATVAAVRSYTPRPYAGQIDLFVTSDKWHRSQQWRGFAGGVREHHLEGFEINDLLLGSHVEILAAALRDTLDARGQIAELGNAAD
jgi:thioesterase domain-containing protein